MAPGVRSGKRALGRLNVYRAANASWYGPGLYGNRTGCGGTLDAGRLGVAHKSLPCGTMVTLKHGRRSVRVPVIDRGPYVAGREYDLTAATAAAPRLRGPRRDPHDALAAERSVSCGDRPRPRRRPAVALGSRSNAATRTPSSRTGRGGA